MEYKCNNCENKSNGLSKKITTNLTGSSYLLDKFNKHTQTTEATGSCVSIYNYSDYDTYKKYTEMACQSGSIEIGPSDSKNIIYFVDKEIGSLYKCHKKVDIRQDVIKVVLYDNERKIHSYPTSSAGILEQKCKCCGEKIIQAKNETFGNSNFI